MFSRVLVANRGEIAVRIVRALHELDIEAVAVYSTADSEALHVELADQAVCIGPPAAADSYLRIPECRGSCRDDRVRGSASRVWIPGRERGLRACVRKLRPDVHRATGRRRRGDGRQGAGEGGDACGRGAAGTWLRRGRGAPGASRGGGRGRFPRTAQGGGRRRRQGHARSSMPRTSSKPPSRLRVPRRRPRSVTAPSMSRNSCRPHAMSRSRCSATRAGAC